MDIRFVTAGGGDVVAVMATDGGALLAAGKALDTASSGRIAKAMKAANFKGGVGQVTDILAPDGVGFRPRAGDRRRQAGCGGRLGGGGALGRTRGEAGADLGRRKARAAA